MAPPERSDTPSKEVITSAANPAIALVRSLARRDRRAAEGAFVVEGFVPSTMRWKPAPCRDSFSCGRGAGVAAKTRIVDMEFARGSWSPDSSIG